MHEPGPEEVFVVSGVFNDGVRDDPAGSFIHRPAGSSHVPQPTTGCRLFVCYPGGWFHPRSVRSTTTVAVCSPSDFGATTTTSSSLATDPISSESARTFVSPFTA